MVLLFIWYNFSKVYSKKIISDYKIESNLILADKTKLTSIDGLNQFLKFKEIHTVATKEIIVPEDIKKSDLGTIPLKKIKCRSNMWFYWKTDDK